MGISERELRLSNDLIALQAQYNRLIIDRDIWKGLAEDREKQIEARERLFNLAIRDREAIIERLEKELKKISQANSPSVPEKPKGARKNAARAKA